MRDYDQWHDAYDDPGSSLSWRLRLVSGYLDAALDRHPGPVRVLSACAGDGRDLFGVLAIRPDAERVRAVLVELHPEIASRARSAAARLSADVEVRVADAGATDSYVGAVPAEIVLMVGIFGNITADDLAQTIAALPQFCAPRATLLWSRGLAAGETNDAVRALLAEQGFVESQYAVFDPSAGGPAVGVSTYLGTPARLAPGRQLFTFVR